MSGAFHCPQCNWEMPGHQYVQCKACGITPAEMTKFWLPKQPQRKPHADRQNIAQGYMDVTGEDPYDAF